MLLPSYHILATSSYTGWQENVRPTLDSLILPHPTSSYKSYTGFHALPFLPYLPHPHRQGRMGSEVGRGSMAAESSLGRGRLL